MPLFLHNGMLESRRDDQVALSDNCESCDIVAFERAIAALHFEAAPVLYQGLFLDGVFVSDGSADFESCVSNTRNRLALAGLRAASSLAD